MNVSMCASTSGSGADKVKVAVRVRPLNRREMDLGTTCIVHMQDDQTIIHPPSGAHSQGACIFAYGQTGSGKSFTMMGSPDSKGIIPRLCDALFDQISHKQTASLGFKVEVSYMEIYNEKVRDLLDPKGTKHNLKLREHNILGPYVDGLSILAVSSFEQIQSLMDEGNKSRTVAATNMNSESSRSHAVFSIKLTQTLIDVESGVSGEKVSKMSLVDLAGSERAEKTGAVGDRLKEGSNINKSLTTLGLVISALADQAGGKGKTKFVPYRDSVLTWLLKDNLGGNSRTVMVATISPASENYEESMSTLRYADRAKRIVNHAVVNEDPNARIIRELREEVEALRAQLSQHTQGEDLRDRLAESEKLMNQLSKSWEDRLKETERIHHEKQVALERMGILVQGAGIKVQHGVFCLVNLNADPSMNELLVYMLKDRTLIGRSDAPVQQDIQLQGLGIMPEHAVITVENNLLFLEPIEGARTCVNGSVVSSKCQLKHGDRVIWGNNHYFRVNCPGGQKEVLQNEHQDVIDYEFARAELMRQELSNDPISNAVASLEKQHEQDKQAALDKQKQRYEGLIKILRTQMPGMTPGTPVTPFGDWQSLTTPSGVGQPFPNSNVQARFVEWAQNREDMFRKGLSRLREEIMKANAAVREANFMASDMNKQTSYHVTLQIPAGNLTPSKLKHGAFVSEPAILVRRAGRGTQMWSEEKLENNLVDMREMYQEWKERGEVDETVLGHDPFYESQETHNLIGVANVFLEVLFHDVKLDYHVPIISQQGEVAGRLHVEIFRVEPAKIGHLLKSTLPDECDLEEAGGRDAPLYGQQITCRVRIKSAAGLPHSLSNFVFCQYSFWNHSEPVVVPPAFDSLGEPAKPQSLHGVTFTFDHEKDFNVVVNDEFLEFVQEGALSIEVLGHKSAGWLPGTDPTRNSWDSWPKDKSRSLQERWAEVTRRLEVLLEVLEMNENGEYAPVELHKAPDVPCGGVFQLRQGLQRRLSVKVKPMNQGASSMLPLVCHQITNISIGCVCARSRTLQKGLDSYQEEDLNILRERWSDALSHRREYLDEEIQRLMHKSPTTKSEQDVEREHALIAQWVALTEERNAVLVPTPNSGVPGAPADWEPPAGMERHVPVLFLDLNADDLSANVGRSAECLQVAGINSILPKEHGGKMVPLQILKFDEHEMSAVASWDSSVHEHVSLNRPTPENERVYAMVKLVVRLSHPAEMELVLRKRVCFNIIQKVGFAAKFIKRFTGKAGPTSSGVIYEIVSNVPKATEEAEARETLALVAAQSENQEGGVGQNGESYIEKYTKGIAQVESMLALDRVRQEVAIRELLSQQQQQQRGKPKKSTSLPDGFTQVRRSLDDGVDQPPRILHAPRRSIPAKLNASDDPSLDQSKSALVASLVSPGRATPRRPAMNPLIEEHPGTEQEQSVAINSITAYKVNSDGSVCQDADVGGIMSQSTTNDSLASAPELGERTTVLSRGAGGSQDDPSLMSSGYGSQTVLSVHSQESLETVMSGDVNGNEECNGLSGGGTAHNLSALPHYLQVSMTTSSASSGSAAMERSSYSDYGALLEPTVTAGSSDDMAVSRESLDNVDQASHHSSSSDKEQSCHTVVPDWLMAGVQVFVQPGNKPGLVKYVGPVEFASGHWVGVALEHALGKHNGTVKGNCYFTCAPQHGVFVKPNKVSPLSAGKRHSSATPGGNLKPAGSSGNLQANLKDRNTPRTGSSGSLNRLTQTTAASAARASKIK